MRHRTNPHQVSSLQRIIVILITSLLIASSAGCQPAPSAEPAPLAGQGSAFTPTSESSPTLEPTTAPPEALAPTATPPEVPATPTAAPEPEATTAPARPVLGGADQIAFFSGGDVWTANLDGSSLTRLTTDGAAKTYLRWLPSGEGLTYIADRCIQSVSLAGVVETITCFNSAKLLESFEVSPDGQRLAISLDSQLYLLPFDLAALRTADQPSDLHAMATCPDLAPYQRNTARFVRWSTDSQRMAAVVLGKLKNGHYADVIQVFDVDQCVPNPLISIRFPDQHFTYLDYNRNPIFQDFAWDGRDQFILHSRPETETFSAMHSFNIATISFTENLNPLGGDCCYRDPQFSPDGSYLAFAFHEQGSRAASSTRLYYIPFASIGSGAEFQPLPLPEITDPREQPQPALRPARP